MREVASFVRMYPAYKVSDALAEYSIVFFTLLSEGYRQLNQELLMASYVALLPNMRDEDRRNFLKQLEYAAQDLNDILKTNTDSASTEDLKRMLR